MNPLFTPQPSLPAAEKSYRSARSTILSIFGFTFINLVLHFVDASIYFLFSAFVPMFLIQLGDVAMAVADHEFTAMIPFALPAVLILLLYLICYFLSEKNGWWLVVATVLFIIDSVLMVLLYLGLGLGVAAITDYIFHGFILLALIGGCINFFKLRKVKKEIETSPAAEYEYEAAMQENKTEPTEL